MELNASMALKNFQKIEQKVVFLGFRKVKRLRKKIFLEHVVAMNTR